MLAPVLALALMQSQTPAMLKSPETASELYADCKAYISLSNGEVHEKEGAKLFNAGVCSGFILGLADGLLTMGHVCPGAGHSDTFVRVYIAYMDKNPKEFDYSVTSGVTGALKEAYPCPAK